ncbi:protein neprosin-like [Nicotiana sylvestris]|uniref:Uncharacterized protein LOC104244444 n=1 Tax=Nicotiana sylvestris TaxID=4096 RepID=A0A1U7Y899_NICSY|nr:PREDICTED: uncharacterized protein LOC104244444 [Nicotiana sylvestris]XP_009798161.1 PREDICTED: uncharacterized protein LOC104244444 [Nicotiana sylvestris]
MLIPQRNVLQILLLLYFLLSYDGVQGEMKLSKLEELALEKQLKLLNKPAVKTIKTKWEDTYDCVDFYKQLAFDHPALKNHNYHPEMKPTLSTIKQIPSAPTVDISSRILLENGGCPSGTVPIKRVTKDDLIRQQHLPQPEDTNFETTGGYRRAIVHTPSDTNNKFVGAAMVASIWNPYVEGQQSSACRLKIQKGPDSMQVGWRVDPTLYGNNHTKFFIHFQAGNTHCFNTLCPGFVLINSNIHLDSEFEHISRRGDEQQWELFMYINRDVVNGNWWLLVGANQTAVGFWPRGIFTALGNDFASNIEWGGVTYTPRGSPYPPMGSSFFPEHPDPTLDAYCRGLVVLDNKGETINANNTPIFLDSPILYRIIDKPNWGPGQFPHYVFYGGPETKYPPL